MRIPDWPVGGCGGALDYAFIPRRELGRTSDRRMLARGCVHDPRSERPRGRRLSRLPAASGRRMVAASDKGGRATRIRADLVTAWEPRDRGSHWAALDERPGIPCDSGCSDQGLAAGIVYGCEPSFPGHLQGG